MEVAGEARVAFESLNQRRVANVLPLCDELFTIEPDGHPFGMRTDETAGDSVFGLVIGGGDTGVAVQSYPAGADGCIVRRNRRVTQQSDRCIQVLRFAEAAFHVHDRSEEHTSELQSR